MRKYILLALVFFTSFSVFGQDFSNKGIDFWTAYGYHQQMTNGGGGGSQDMLLYFATDTATTITVTIPGIGWTRTYVSGNGNNIITSDLIPKSIAMGGDACLRAESTAPENKGIHITSDMPMVAYAHVANGSVSGATILYPTNTLGKEYYSVNYENISNSANANCWFYVIATDTGTTQIEITPSYPTINHLAGVPFTINLTQGQVYNLWGTFNNLSNPQKGVDLTGSKIKSLANGNGGCKKIAVFSGSGRISLTCNGTSSSSDNYMVQALPKSAWGRNYLTVPTAGYNNVATAAPYAYNLYRVCVTDVTTRVSIDGVLTALPLIDNFYYNVPVSNTTHSITADKAIMVAQYLPSRNQCNNPAPAGDGDPEVIYLSPVEQSIKKVTWNACRRAAITATKHYINFVIPNAGTAISSCTLDGVTVPAASFITHPQNSNYSYAVLNVSGTNNVALSGIQHTLQSDSGFNAIAYGYGGAESYGYNAGTNVRDLTQALEIETQYGIETSPSVCTNSPFKFKIYFPDSTLTTPVDSIRFDSLRWDFHLASTIVPNNFPIVQIHPTIDSTNMRNGRQVNWYSIPGFYYVTTPGLDSLILTAYRSTSEGCGNEQVYYFPIPAYNPPVADFAWTPGGCVAEAYQFTETTPQFPKPTYKWWWDFGDTGSGAANNSLLRNPTHTFSAPGTYTVRYSSITTPGCLSDTIPHTVFVPDFPNATIAGNTTVCINSAPQPVTFTGTLGTAEYIFGYTIDNGGGPGPVQFTPPSLLGIATVMAPATVAGTFVYNLVSVRNASPAGTPCIRNITGQSITINITPDATVTLTSAAGTDNQTVCINNPIVNITYAIGGSGTGGSVSGLPPGVTGSFAGGVVTITGTPTSAAGSPYTYTVTTTGPCITPSKTGTITVTDDATLALTSGPGSDNQTLCINTPILINITYAVGGTGTGGSVSGLPAGVSGVYAGGVITISGTPTVAGVFNYTVTTTGPCVKPSATGTITVTADGTLTLTSAAGTDNQARCINIPITNITYAVGGTANGGSVSGLPPGITWVYAGGVITISGTPTLIGVFNYTVSTTGPCVKPTATGTITVNPDASIVLTSAAPTTSQELCRNSTITNITYAISGGGTGAGVTGLPAGVTGVYAGGVFTISGAPLVAGLFNYTVTTTGTCLQTGLSGTILVDQLPTASFTYTSPSCETRVIGFNDGSVPNIGTLTNWTWDFGDGPPTSNLQNPSHVYAAAGPYTVTLTVTNSKGCISNPIASTVVNINNRPQAGFIIPEVCLSDTYAQFLDTSKLTNAVIDRWDWNFGDPGSGPLNTSTLQNPTHSYSAVGPYSVRLIVWNFAKGCRDTITQNLFVNGSFPVANYTVNNPATLCANDSVGIVEASTVFPGVITKVEIYWDNVNFPAVFQLDNNPFTGKTYRHLYPNFQSPLTKVFQIRYRAYSGGVCVNDKLGNITVNAAPLVQFNNMPNTCLLVPPFQITQASEIGGVPGTGVYSGPGVSPTGLFTPQVAGIGTHTILYTYTSTAAGCVDTMSNTITVLDTAHASFSVVLPSCEQIPTSFTDLSTAPAAVVLANTVWNFNDATPIENHAPGSTFGHTFPGPGTYTVTMHNVSAYGCLSTDTSAQVTIDANHHITLNAGSNANQSVCINTPITPIVYTLTGGATGATVTGLPAGVNAVVAGNTLTISGTPSPAAGGPIFPFTILTTGNTCVVANAAGSITVQPDHTIAFNSGDTMQSVCVNTPIDNIVYDLGGGATGISVLPGGNLPPGVSANVSGNTVTISGTPTATGTFNYNLQTTGNACVKANVIGQIVVHPYPVPAFTVDKPAYCIPNAIVKFTNGSATPGGIGMTYAWDFGDGSPLDFSVNPTHWYTSGIGPFTVRLAVTSIAIPILNGGLPGCAKFIDSVMNNIHPQPKADFVFSKPSVCIGDNVIITDNTDGRDGIVNQWHWDLGDGTTEVRNPVPHTYPDTITYVITMYSVNSFGCNSDTINKLPLVGPPYKPFTVYPYPHRNAGPDKSVLEGGSVMLEATAFANDPQYSWTPTTYLTDARILRPRVVDPKTDMTYRLTVTGRGGCALSDDVFVKLLRFPVIPNTFSPNNDGINDTWRIDYLNTYPDNRVQIFTRTGKLVFESRGYDTPWDGTLKGKPLPFDTYYYIIEPGNGRDPITGYVTILK